MHPRIQILLCLLTLIAPGMAHGQQSPPSSSAQQATTPPTQPGQNPDAAQTPADTQAVPSDPDVELQVAVQQAGSDGAALIRNLEAYLAHYPDSPRRPAIYRAMMQSEIQGQNLKRALDYAEKAIALQPDDIQTMYAAITILDRLPDQASQLHEIDYATRLIDRVAKADPESRPEQMTIEDWQAGRNKFTSTIYGARGRSDRRLHKDDEALKDFTASFNLVPSANAALNLGEIAEQQKKVDDAVHLYAMAFLLTGQEQQDENSVDQDSIRVRMGNFWRFTHDSNSGLGDVLLAAYDNNKAMAKADRPDAPVYNKGITDPLKFSLRHVDGTPAVNLADAHGKTIVLSFWTTWCSYCRITEPMLADVRKKFDGRNDVVFLSVDADEEEKFVSLFVKTEKLDGTLVFADGIDQVLHVESIPTVIVLDRAGKIAYRTQGFAPDNFADVLSSAITKASSGQ